MEKGREGERAKERGREPEEQGVSERERERGREALSLRGSEEKPRSDRESCVLWAH